MSKSDFASASSLFGRQAKAFPQYAMHGQIKKAVTAAFHENVISSWQSFS
ncbi:hypothetical protein PORCRE_1689 [Porphyromonas crevioricanis JCM 15906]|uniref:Uncharacterized protein n=1 Tax=Porphyromonas crevioricanis JCM 15906 TaxID=1305617 RepID=T1DT31_9PORP|nr:hypothetical protein PORCRE_1689 [Porphyromonas crevioricanis JCM 15906]GAD08365.1 hypothetical protein PORCAN_2007 [Porphyromonas crevioricanis JCM 13913]